MTENSGEHEPAPPERKEKDKKKKKGEKSKIKKTRRHFREETQRARTQDTSQTQEVKLDTNQAEPELIESATNLSPSAIVEMFHLQDMDNSSSTSVAVTARYLVENETSGDFYQVRTRRRKQHEYISGHSRHRRSSLVKAQQRVRGESTRAENSVCWTILQRDGEKAVVVMLLGIVTGMCWVDALNLRPGGVSSSRKDFDIFVCMYSAGLNRSRQNLFILFKYPSH
ncbi:ABC transporter B family member 11 [Phytophthora nicotianae]|uniref:ABC transporter B family member 11 n=1 Tax=Phytophthora nicotianae TaxID=4792 RepID=A0A0W8D5T4_PHYNI|nr:ABC transporter B family member 11 [Phytophthora nicotianae]